MSVDREAAVKKAEDLVREGKPDLAIEEYLRLVEDQPGDVGAANALGDLYAKVGNRASAVAQFVQIGDIHRESGFIPKAVAFYKKALKVDPASDHALSYLAQIAVGQELFADATLYLNRLLQRRREQNNEAGVADCLVRLGGFPSATADAKTAAARAAAGHFPPSEVSRLWIEAADALERAGRPREAADVLIQAAGAGTDDATLARRVAVACANTGQIERAQAFLSFDIAGDRGDLLMALARHALGQGRDDEARRALQRVILVAPELREEAESLLAPLLSREPDGPADEVTILAGRRCRRGGACARRGGAGRRRGVAGGGRLGCGLARHRGVRTAGRAWRLTLPATVVRRRRRPEALDADGASRTPRPCSSRSPNRSRRSATATARPRRRLPRCSCPRRTPAPLPR